LQASDECETCRNPRETAGLDRSKKAAVKFYTEDGNRDAEPRSLPCTFSASLAVRLATPPATAEEVLAGMPGAEMA
jgi:hypothetical protein